MDKKIVLPRRSTRSVGASSNQSASSSRQRAVVSKEEKVMGTRSTGGIQPRRSKSRKPDQSPSSGSMSEQDGRPGRKQSVPFDEACCCCQCRKCGCDGGDTPRSAGAATNAIQRDRKMKLAPERPGTYEPEEDTMVEARNDEWSPRKGGPKRSVKYTCRQVIGKIIEYGIVAGIVVAIFAVVHKKQ